MYLCKFRRLVVRLRCGISCEQDIHIVKYPPHLGMFVLFMYCEMVPYFGHQERGETPHVMKP